jgi:hypothetical protein
MGLAIISLTLGLVVVLLSWRAKCAGQVQLQYTRLLYRTFHLREDLVKLQLDSIITKNECERLYLSINWAVKYLRDLPIFVVKGFAEALRSATADEDSIAFEEELRTASPELKSWYGDFSDVLDEAVHLHTPMSFFSKCSDNMFCKWICPVIFAIWYSTRLAALRNHPLRNIRIVYPRSDIEEIKRAQASVSEGVIELRQILAA